MLETREMLDKAGITEQRAALAAAAGQSFYNTSRFTLRDLNSRGSQQIPTHLYGQEINPETYAIHLGKGKTFTVRTANNSPENRHIQSARLEGKPFTETWLTHNTITAGGVIGLSRRKSAWPRSPVASWGMNTPPVNDTLD